MHLVFGGAYQGKLDYVKERYDVKETDIYTCSQSEPANFDYKVIEHLEHFVLYCLRNRIEAKDYLEAHKEEWKGSILICNDISSGIVPYEAEQRAWREMTGRTMVYLGKEAEETTRIFCGIPQKLK